MKTMFGKGENEGPTVIPAHVRTKKVAERRVCDGCRYFDSRREGNVCGGFGARLGPLRTECRHPDAMTYYEDHAKLKSGEQIPLRTPDRGVPRVISRDAGFGGYDNSTPDWCPFLKQKEGEKK